MERYALLHVSAVTPDGRKIPGAVFGFVDWYGRQTQFSSDDNGIATCYLRYSLNYYMRIIKPPAGYAAIVTPLKVQCDRRGAVWIDSAIQGDYSFTISPIVKSANQIALPD